MKLRKPVFTRFVTLTTLPRLINGTSRALEHSGKYECATDPVTDRREPICRGLPR
ncbi:unnamed protein product [Hymenolepis diminuta]|uniref:Uncharacterized protein n=1 Tax=Hymenolepis diminuta TaxID=6216 RepID=A0A564YRP4_HYMDI|nr:unnamed protein product [Hymenolepis diminuta]